MVTLPDYLAHIRDDEERAEMLSSIVHEIRRRQRSAAAYLAALRVVCYLCHEDLPASAFHRAVNRPNGLNAACKSCHSAAAKRRRLARFTAT